MFKYVSDYKRFSKSHFAHLIPCVLPHIKNVILCASSSKQLIFVLSSSYLLLLASSAIGQLTHHQNHHWFKVNWAPASLALEIWAQGRRQRDKDQEKFDIVMPLSLFMSSANCTSKAIALYFISKVFKLNGEK